MKKPLTLLLCFIHVCILSNIATGQSFGTFASAVWITDCNQSNFFNTSGTGGDLIGPSGNVFTNTNLGVHTQNSGTLILRGASVKTFKAPATANVCSVRFHYRIYLQNGTPGAYTIVDLPLLNNCDLSSGQFTGGGGSCQAGDQLWQRVSADGTINPYAPVNLTNFAPGNYVLEVYYDAAGSHTTTNGCSDTVVLDNNGSNYKAFFSIQYPYYASNNPVTCNGTEGYITFSGLVAGAVYSVTYTDNGLPVGPVTITANGSGQVILTGLNAGLYSNFSLKVNGCTTNLFIGIILSNPLFITSFSTIPPFCAGSTAPVLPSISNNGISGTWNPAVIDNQNSGVYSFTPAGGQCGIPTTMSVTVIPRTTPTFSFGTSLNICVGGTVPLLPTTSTNNITGTWSPAIVDNQNSGTYIFTPTAGQCALPATFTVTVNPNITPTFSFGTSLNICAGGSVPALPNTSTNGINGTWNPVIVDNQNSGTYTFTPTAGQCALPATFTVTVNPNITPTFSFGTSLNICAGGSVPALSNTSTNNITGTWNPAVVDNQNSGTYTFTPTAGQCALTATFTVTVNPILIPTFSFGTNLTVCAGSSVPALSNTSTNNITGSWSPATIDNQNSGTYTFTPAASQCATNTALSVTVTPIIIPVFSIGATLSICTGGSVPLLPATSDNGITGTWNPATVSNQTSGVYTFTPTATPQQCISTATFTVTVNQIVTPAFSFGTSQSICIGATVPALTTTSANGITGTWFPSIIDNQNSTTYSFTPTAGQCATIATLNVTINPIPTVVVRADTTLNDGDLMPVTDFSGTPSGVVFNWINSNPSIGLPGSGTGNIPSFIALNKGNNPVTATINVTPAIGGCAGTARSYMITVKALNKDVFVPNVFSPNGDGKNDKLFAYGNYVDKLEMRIFNQWGEQIIFINSLSQGWDGTHRGKPQPVGVYVYVLKAKMTNGRDIQLKGSITLLR